MKALITMTLAAALAGCGAMAPHGPGGSAGEGMRGGMHGNVQHGGMHGSARGERGTGMGMASHMRAMDTNGDGMLSKAEFLKAHEGMFDRMKKNEQGQVALASMGAMGSKGEMGSMEMCPMMQRR